MDKITLEFWQILAIAGAVWFIVLSGVIVGAWFMFRGKRETHENFFKVPFSAANKGDVFTIDDGVEGSEGDPTPPERDSALKEHHEAFMGQLGLGADKDYSEEEEGDDKS